MITTHIRGFTLIETLVAVTILMVLVVGPLSSLAQSLTDTQHTLNLATASYLMEEGAETIRAYLSPNIASGSDLLAATCSAPNSCGVEEDISTVAKVQSCANLNACVIRWDGSLYQHSSGVNTYFTRTVSVSKQAIASMDPSVTNPVYEVMVIVIVSWNDGTGTKLVSTKDYYYTDPSAPL